MYLLSRCQWVTTHETSPDWAGGLLAHISSRPSLLRRWELRHIPVDWAPNWEHRSQGYWADNDVCLDLATARRLEKRYLMSATEIDDDHTVLIIDGGMRSHLYVLFQELGLFERFEIVVIDNMELPFPALVFERRPLSGFTRFDFVAGSFDNKLPPELNGRQVTSIFVRDDRMRKTIEVETENPYRWEPQDLLQHQNFTADDDSRPTAERWEVRVRRELHAYDLLPSPVAVG